MNTFDDAIAQRKAEARELAEHPNRYVYRVDRIRLGVPLPKDRPRCPYCNKTREPILFGPEVIHDDVNRVTTKTFRWSGVYSDRYGPFCRMRCALWFAEAAYRRGYRIQHPKP